jgi:hypothetical protein
MKALSNSLLSSTRNTLSRSAVALVILFSASLLSAAPSRALLLQNEHLALTLDAAEGAAGDRGITLVSLQDTVTHHEFVSRATYLFEFSPEGGVVDRSNVNLKVDKITSGNGRYFIEAHAKNAELAFTLDISLAPGDLAAVLLVTVHNNSARNVRLRMIFPRIRGLVTPGDANQAWGAIPQEIGYAGPLYVPPAGNIAAVMRDAVQEDLFYTRYDGNIWTVFQRNNGAWTDPVCLTQPDVLLCPSQQGPAAQRGSVAAVRRNELQEDVFFVDIDGAVSTIFELNNGAWSPPIKLSPNGMFLPGSKIAALMRNSQQEDIFLVGKDNRLYTLFQVNNGDWSTPLPLAQAAPGGVAAVMRNNTKEDVFYTAGDGSIWTVSESNNGGWSQPVLVASRFSTRPGADLAAVTRNAQREDVFFLASDGALWNVFELNGGAWSAVRLSTENVAPAGGNLTALMRNASQEDVFYAGFDGILWTVFSLNNAAFSAPIALTEARFLPAEANLAAVARNSNQEDVFMGAVDGGIWTTYELGGSAWIEAVFLTTKQSVTLGMPFNLGVGLPNSLNTLEVASLYDPKGGGGVFFADLDSDLVRGAVAPLQFTLSAVEVDAFWVGDIPAFGSLPVSRLAIGINHSGDWHTAVEYAAKAHEGRWTFPDIPPWFRDQGAIYTFSGGGAGGIYLGLPLSDLKSRLADFGNISPFRNLTRLLDEAKELGTNVVYLWDYWDGDPTDHATPPIAPYFFKGDYVPRSDSGFGGPNALTDVIKTIHQRGGKVIVYLESFLISRGAQLGGKKGSDWDSDDPTHGMAATYSCNPTDRHASSLCSYKMTPAHSPWVEYIAGKAKQLVTDYDVDGIFLDSAGWQNNWAAHVQDGSNYTSLQFSRGLPDLVARVRTAVQSVKPDAIVMGETTSGQLSQVWDGGLSGDFFFPFERDINKGRILASPARFGLPAANYFSNGLNMNQLNQIYAAGHSLALCCNYPGTFIFDNKVLIGKMVRLRQKYKDALIYGIQRYQPLTGTPDVSAYVYEGTQSQIITVVNISSTPYTGQLQVDSGQIGSSWADELNGGTFNTQNQSTSLAINVPGQSLRVLVRQKTRNSANN